MANFNRVQDFVFIGCLGVILSDKQKKLTAIKPLANYGQCIKVGRIKGDKCILTFHFNLKAVFVLILTLYFLVLTI